MRINWKIRRKNVLFIVQIIASVFVPILAYFGYRWEDMTSWIMIWHVLLEAFKNPVVILPAILAIFNAITDPTTKGASDSDRAMTYTEPH